jgi:hypothetical protein
MRVPVYPSDLESQQGFKRVAKKLNQDWCGSLPINLSLAQEILSRGFGYNDYHDVLRSAAKWPADAALPSAVDVHDSVVKASLMAAQQRGMTIVLGQLQQLVQSLPLNMLASLKHFPAAQLPAATPQAPQSPQLQQRHQVPVSTASPKHIPDFRSMSSMPAMDREELTLIARVVEQSANRRDMALLAFLLQGMRPQEFLGLKVGEVLRSAETRPTGPSIDVLRWTQNKSGGESDRSTALIHHGIMSTPPGDVLLQHIRENALSPDDYLFSSYRDPKAPLTSKALNKICGQWVAPRKRTPASFRRSLIQAALSPFRQSDLSQNSIRSMVSHTSISHTEFYLNRAEPKSDS